MRWVPRSFPVEIRRELIVANLADISEQQLEQADEEGALAGNHFYFDMRGFSWQDVRAALEAEIVVINRLKWPRRNGSCPLCGDRVGEIPQSRELIIFKSSQTLASTPTCVSFEPHPQKQRCP